MFKSKKYRNLIYRGANGRKSPLDLFIAPERDRSKPLVIFAHGYKGFKDWGCWDLVGNAFNKAGFDFLKFNFSHNGGTVEEPIDFPDLEAFSENTYSMEMEDIKKVTDMVSMGIQIDKKIYKWKEIALIGHSRAGGIAILHAARSPRVTRLATWAAVADFGERFNFDMEAWKKEGVTHIKNGRTGQMMPHKYSYYTDYIENKSELDIEAAAKKLRAPHIIFHGDADEGVKPDNANRIAEWNPEAELNIIKNTGHTFGAKHPWEQEKLPGDLRKVVDETVRFFSA